MSRFVLQFALAVALTLACQSITQADFTVNFDDVAASPYFGGTVPGGPAGPTYARLGATFTGGVVLNGAAFDRGATSSHNLYATSDFNSLANGSLLPGAISVSLAAPVFGVSLDITDGNGAASFTLTAFSASNALLSSATVVLGDFLLNTDLGHLTVSSPIAIDHFTVTTTQTVGARDFGIDTVVFTSPINAVPEPSSLALCGVAGMAVLGVGRVRRRRLVA